LNHTWEKKFFGIQTFLAYLVLGGVHPADHSEQSNFCYFSKLAGDVQLCKIISRDLLGRFGQEYAFWKGQIVCYFQLKIWNFILNVLYIIYVQFHAKCKIRYMYKTSKYLSQNFMWLFAIFSDKKYSNFSNTVIWIHVSNVVKSSYAKDIRINSPHLKHVFI
jgi:hypothetical protein